MTVFVTARRLAAGIAIALVAGACNKTTPTTTPTTPTAEQTAETFTGGMNINGAVSFSFIAAQAGQITSTLTSLSDSTLTVGFALGTWNGTVCQVVLANDKAVQGTNVIGAVTGAGSLCARIYDVGSLTGPITFEIQVVHP